MYKVAPQDIVSSNHVTMTLHRDTSPDGLLCWTGAE